MRFQVLTIFPELIQSFAEVGLIGRAVSEGRIAIEAKQLRDFAINTQGQIDDTPYGGGSGMVLRPEAAAAAIEFAKERDPGARVVVMTPRGKPFNQELARRYAAESAGERRGIIVLCCRYEGVDERVVTSLVDDELCIGDFVLMGGEVAAMAMMEAVGRLVPGVLGNPQSLVEESF